jgi:ABC-type multidrug transport system ATPase subunit
VIVFDNVSKRYRSLLGREVRALRGVSLTVARGEVLGVAGPNGAGKSTLINLLLGFLPASGGRVLVNDLAPRVYVERHGVGYLSELMAVPPRWTARSALARYAVLAGLGEPEVGPRVRAVIALLGLEEHADKTVKTLSKGTLQRVGLAQALLRDEDLLVLDEPTHGLDPVWTARFRDLVTELRRPSRAILIASHNLDELERLADRVAILDDGALQRVVHTGANAAVAAAVDGAVAYRVAFARGAELAAEHFPGARALGRGEVELQAASVAALNAGLAALLARGALVTAVAPTHSALERQFRDAVRVDA